MNEYGVLMEWQTGETRLLREKCVHATMLTANPTQSDLELNPPLHNERPTSNRLSSKKQLLTDFLINV
jgi:hypothetical protein